MIKIGRFRYTAKEVEMFIKKSIVLFVGVLVFFGASPGVTNQEEKIPGDFFQKLKTLADTKKEDKDYGELFTELLTDEAQLGKNIKAGGTIEAEWIKSAGETGGYIGEILLKHLGEPEDLGTIAQFLTKLREALTKANYVTVGCDIYNAVIEVIDNASPQEEASRDFFENAGLMKKLEETEKKLVFDRLAEFTGIVSAYRDHLVREQLMEKKIKSELEKRQEEWHGKMKTAVNNTGMQLKESLYKKFLYIGLLFLFLVALNLFYILFFIKRRMVKKKLDQFGSEIEGIRNTLKRESNGFQKKEIYSDQIFLSSYLKEDGSMVNPNELPGTLDGHLKQFRAMVNERLIGIESDLKKIKQEYPGRKIGEKNGIERRIQGIEEQLRRINHFLDAGRVSPSPGEMSLAGLIESIPGKVTEEIADAEREVLKETWNWETFKTIRVKSAMFSESGKNNEFFDLCYEMEKRLTFNEDFLLSYKNTVSSLRNYDEILTNIVNIPKITGAAPGPRLKGPTPGKDLQIIRRHIYFLISLQSTDILSNLPDFTIEKWVKEEFLEFTDQFMRYYQRSVFEGKETGQLEEVKRLIDKILVFVNIEVIPLELGKTLFDSTLHIGRSHTREASMYDGTVADVVRSGYREINGVVIQQPEVIVNRL
ncbi:MAG: hypothetical protein KAW12_17110 [Candidatus Aminicenantes bacterium]|nr:hypothetical protein [Candidatus Aminicenantes bacterium]